MTKTFLAGVLALASTAAMAQDLDFSTSVSLEHESKGDVNNLIIGNNITGLPYGLTISTGINLHDTKSGIDFTLEDIDLDVSKSITDNVSAYINTDLNKNVERTETTVGITITF